MREAGLLARERIYRRTVAGRDADNLPFAPYSKAYAELKQAAVGRTGVTLQLSGAMLNAMTLTEVTPTSVTIGFSR